MNNEADKVFNLPPELIREVQAMRAALPDCVRGVYFLQSGATGNIKIGSTADFQQRLTALQVDSPEELRLLAFLNCRNCDPSVAEDAMHKKFESYRSRGEWFIPSEELLAFCRDIGIDNTTKLEPQLVIHVNHPRPETVDKS